MDLRKRSFAKAVTWRITAFTITLILSLIIIRDVETSIILSVVMHVLNTFLYYAHERIWNVIQWGRSKAPSRR